MHCPECKCELKEESWWNNCPACGARLKKYCTTCGEMEWIGNPICLKRTTDINRAIKIVADTEIADSKFLVGFFRFNKAFVMKGIPWLFGLAVAMMILSGIFDNLHFEALSSISLGLVITVPLLMLLGFIVLSISEHYEDRHLDKAKKSYYKKHPVEYAMMRLSQRDQ